ncbi:MAG: hypothetical protein KAR14_12610, partial [Candidatus Aminicenantes bacterium]|nr:hypothetical protein [Candidatus Aminicenantes bacterium]
MKKLVLFVFVSVLIVFSLNGETFPLEEVLNPDSIFVSSERVYITEGATIYVYSKDNLKYIGKFGKKGEGPGEINASRMGGLSFNLNVVNNNIFIHNRSKVMFFEKNGRFIREKKLTGGFIRGMTPVGSNFVARSFKIGENRSRTESISIYNNKFKKIGEVTGKKGSEFTRGSFVKIYFDQNIFNMKTHGKTIYLNNSKDFVINTYDESGKKLNPLKIKYSPLKISGSKKAEIKNYYKNDSRFSDFWERIKDMFDIADQYPAIKNFFVTDNKIYVHTFKR